MTPIYEISTSVAEALSACVANEIYTFAVVEPSRTDSIERRKKLQKEWDEISELIQMDLLKDVSYKFQEQIRDCHKTHGFQYKVVELSEIAVQLFADITNRRVN